MGMRIQKFSTVFNGMYALYIVPIYKKVDCTVKCSCPYFFRYPFSTRFAGAFQTLGLVRSSSKVWPLRQCVLLVSIFVCVECVLYPLVVKICRQLKCENLLEACILMFCYQHDTFPSTDEKRFMIVTTQFNSSLLRAS